LAQDAAHRVVDGGDRHLAGVHQLGQVLLVGLNVESVVQARMAIMSGGRGS
jgi:hypothetical protein